MKVTELSSKASRFEGTHFGTSSVTASGVQIHFVEIDGWLRVVIELSEDSTSNELRDAIPLALSWRDRLLDWQGPWIKGGDNPFLEELSMRQEDGEAYAELAERINFTITEHLSEFNDYLNELELVRSHFTTELDFYHWESKANQFAFDHARGLLKAVRLKADDIESLLRSGLENIQVGRPAFEKGYPISRDKLIGTLKSWRQSRKHRLAQEKFYKRPAD
jgi:hypothetical protein